MRFLPSLVLTLAFFAIIYSWATGTFPWLARKRRALVAGFASLLVLQPLARWAVIHWHSDAAEALHTTISVFIMALGLATIPIGLLRAASWFGTRLRRIQGSSGLPAATGIKRAAPSVTRRQIVEGGCGMAFLGASGTLLGWGAVRGRHMFEVCELPVPIPGLPRALDGYVIAQISDIHAGTHVGERTLDEGFELVRRIRPDLIVVTGDHVDLDSRYAPVVARKLADLPSRDGVASILGNHDYYADADAVVAALRAAGIQVLIDEGRLIRAGDGGGFALLGVDDQWAFRSRRGAGPRLDRALAMVPPDAPRILLSHQPPTIERWAGRVTLQLSGHTHGGQINPGFRPADLFFPYLAGRYSVGGSTLYVNRGFGTVGPPARIGAPPEITRIVLVAA
jgi:predicted MPP superfamily phosphohydrolase